MEVLTWVHGGTLGHSDCGGVVMGAWAVVSVPCPHTCPLSPCLFSHRVWEGEEHPTEQPECG